MLNVFNVIKENQPLFNIHIYKTPENSKCSLETSRNCGVFL